MAASEGAGERAGRSAPRWHIDPDALAVLEAVFSLEQFPNVETRRQLGIDLSVSSRQIQVWFQNRRQRERKHQSLSDTRSISSVSLASTEGLPIETKPAAARANSSLPLASIPPAAAAPRRSSFRGQLKLNLSSSCLSSGGSDAELALPDDLPLGDLPPLCPTLADDCMGELPSRFPPELPTRFPSELPSRFPPPALHPRAGQRRDPHSWRELDPQDDDRKLEDHHLSSIGSTALFDTGDDSLDRDSNRLKRKGSSSLPEHARAGGAQRLGWECDWARPPPPEVDSPDREPSLLKRNGSSSSSTDGFARNSRAAADENSRAWADENSPSSLLKQNASSSSLTRADGFVRGAAGDNSRAPADGNSMTDENSAEDENSTADGNSTADENVRAWADENSRAWADENSRLLTDGNSQAMAGENSFAGAAADGNSRDGGSADENSLAGLCEVGRRPFCSAAAQDSVGDAFLDSTPAAQFGAGGPGRNSPDRNSPGRNSLDGNSPVLPLAGLFAPGGSLEMSPLNGCELGELGTPPLPRHVGEDGEVRVGCPGWVERLGQPSREQAAAGHGGGIVAVKKEAGGGGAGEGGWALRAGGDRGVEVIGGATRGGKAAGGDWGTGGGWTEAASSAAGGIGAVGGGWADATGGAEWAAVADAAVTSEVEAAAGAMRGGKAAARGWAAGRGWAEATSGAEATNGVEWADVPDATAGGAWATISRPMSLDDLHRELAGGDLISRGGDLLSPPPGRELAMRGLISSPPGRELAGRDMKGDIFSPLPGLPALPWAATTGAGAHVQGAAGGGVTPLNVSAGLALACQASLLGRTLQLYGGVVQVVTEPGPPYRIISVSAGWERMCGYSHNEVVGKSLSFLQDPETARAPVDALMSAVHQSRPALVRLTNYTKSGASYDHQVSVEPLTDPSGIVRAFQATSLLLRKPGEARGALNATAASALPLISKETVPPLWPLMARLIRPNSPPPPVSNSPPPSVFSQPHVHTMSAENSRRAGGRGGSGGVSGGGGAGGGGVSGGKGHTPAQAPHELDQEILTWLESDHPADAELEALVY